MTNDGRSHKQAIVLRKDLGMTAGKMVSQGAHASMKAVMDQGERRMVEGRPALVIFLDDEKIAPWLNGLFTKVTTRVESESDLLALHERAKSLGLNSTLITDSGLTQFAGVPTNTAIAIGPDVREAIDAVTGNLKLL